ncbi:hypothetical protein [Chitinolyticbacter meiyuanensis]|uniref:hypothetical protein n=1 Tax=Chitinolyticbacter meiyuanensis TaxID=682798 RepID=UPI0011E5FD26|nr:hypothetical protein [Chitinolyticbacter meiyuanensis]
MHKVVKAALLAMSTGLLLNACGGGGGGGDDPVPTPAPTPAPSPSISGVAAAGAPLSGTVTVKDANGVTRSVPIGADGGYRVDVAGLTAPFVFRAEGVVGGRLYVVHSAATAADVGGTINVTPLTDLIIANIAGDLASNFFDNPNFASLTATELAEQSNALKARLQDVLTGLGIESTIDLLRTSFATDHSGLDAALDVLRVTVDPATQQATITNLLTNTAITDDLKSKADATKLPDPGDIKAVVTDLQGIEAALKAFTGKFANGLPTIAEVEPLLDADFRQEDQNRANFLADVTSDPNNVGIQFTGVTLESPAQETQDGTIARVGFTVLNKDGKLDNIETGWRVKKVTDGGSTRWLLMGNRARFVAEAYPLALRNYHNGEVTYSTGMEFWIEDENAGNNNGVVSYALVKGPGLPDTGVRYNVPQLGGHFCLAGGPQGYCNTQYVLNDVAINSIPDNSSYDFEFYTAADQKLNITTTSTKQTRVILRRPHTNGELANLTFPVLVKPAPTEAGLYNGGPIAIQATFPTGYAFGVTASYATTGGYSEYVDIWQYDSPATFSETFDLAAVPSGQTVNWAQIKLDYSDEKLRNILSVFTVTKNIQ